ARSLLAFEHSAATNLLLGELTMKRLKLFMITAAALISYVPCLSAQTPGPQFWRRATCEPIEPRTRLENLDQRYSTVIVKGFTRVTTIDLRGIRVDAVEMHQPGRAES